MEATLLVLSLDSMAARHLARALEDHRRWCRTNAVALPPALEQLALAVRAGQSRSTEHDNVDVVEAASVAIAYTYTEAGQLLGVSESTIRRLVRSRELRAVSVAGTRRIHRDDLTQYAESLRQQEAS